MSKTESWLRTGALLAVAGCACFALWRVSVAADALRVPDVAPTLARVNATVDLVNRPCASKDANGHLLPDGPICELDQAIHDIRKITTQSGKQVEQTGELIKATSTTLTSAGNSVKEVATSLSGTAQAATDALSEGKRTIASAQPLLASLTRNSDDFDALLKSHALMNTLDNLDATTQNIGGITLDLRKVTDKASADYLKPVPTWKKIGRYAGDLFDYGAFVARHY